MWSNNKKENLGVESKITALVVIFLFSTNQRQAGPLEHIDCEQSHVIEQAFPL